jgi:hypothetical protein
MGRRQRNLVEESVQVVTASGRIGLHDVFDINRERLAGEPSIRAASGRLIPALRPHI